MRKFFQGVFTALMMVVLVAGLYGCKKEGTAEKAGKEIDKTIQKAGEGIEKAGEAVKDFMNDVKK